MCKIIKISHSTYYSYEETEAKRDKINDIVVKIFNENQHVYGTRKLKVELAKKTTKYRGGVFFVNCQRKHVYPVNDIHRIVRQFIAGN